MNRPPLGRLGVLLVAFLVGFFAIGVRLIFLQVRDAEALGSMATEQRVRTVPLPAQRGAILDRFGRHFALSVDAKAIYADQRYITDPYEVASQIAELLGMKVGELARLLRGEASFVYVARQVDRDVAQQVADLKIPGLGFLDESERHYPAKELAAQVIGYVDTDGNGLGGLELEYDTTLKGVAGERTVEIDPDGRQIPQGVHQENPPVPGEDLVTTIDQQLQYQAQVALTETVKAEHAQGGTLIALNPHTGEIYAMASTPEFDPNDIGPRDEDHLHNPAVADVFEPGSVNKVITASAVVEEGVVGLREAFHVPDSYTESFPDGDVTVHDSHPHGVERMYLGDIIAQSSNVGTIMVAKDHLGPDLLASYFGKFGFGQSTGLGLPGETAGLLPAEYEWSGASMLNLPIGQGVSVSPLQMAQVYATVANDGVRVDPQLVKGTVDAAGTFHPAPQPERHRVMSVETADVVTGMLARVVTEGTGTNANIPGYWVAGKTGTAQKPKEDGTGYSNEFMASFIGFLPASDPQLVIAVVIDDPDSEYGGEAAAPLFQRFGREAIARLRIPTAGKPDFPPSALHG